MKARLKRFEEQNPDISIELLQFAGFTQVKEKLFTMLASGSAPDVVHTSLNDAGELINNGALMDVTEYTKELNFADYFFTDVYMRNGRVYGGLDTHAQVHPVYINKNMFANAGLPSPNQYHQEGTWNWDTFLKVSKKLTIMDGAGKITQFGALMNNSWGSQMFRTAAGGRDFAADEKTVTFDTPEVRQAVQFQLQLLQDHVMPRVGESLGTEPFANNKVAMDFQSSWRMNWLNTNAKGLSWDIVPTPKGPKGNSTVRTPAADGLVVAGTKHPDEAWRLVKYFLSEQNQADKARTKLEVPMNKRALTGSGYMMPPPDSMWVIAELLNRSVPYPGFMGSNEALTAVNQQMANVWNFKVPPETAIPEAQRLAQIALNNTLAKLK